MAPFPARSASAPEEEEGEEEEEEAIVVLAASDMEDSSDSGESIAVSAPVGSIGCSGCSTELSARGMQVFLVMDGSTLFSTDIPSDSLREGGPRIIPTCECVATDVLCRGCDATVGYHVLTPCSVCASAEHNGHFWLFDESRVSWVDRGLTWDALPYNGQPDTDTEFIGTDEEGLSGGAMSGGEDATAAWRHSNGASASEAAEQADALTQEVAACCVCAASPMYVRGSREEA